MKKAKVLLALMFAFIFTISMLAGCTTTAPQTSSPAATASEAATVASTVAPTVEATQPPVFKKYDPPVVITTARWCNPDQKFRDGDSWDNNVWTRFISDTLGIQFKDAWTAPGWGDFETKLSLNIASGEPMPDVIFDFYNAGNATLAKIVDNNELLMPVGDAYDKYASDFVKQAQASVLNDIRMPFTKDGQVYALPNPNDGMGNVNCLYFRKDWLDTLGLQLPKTIDDLDPILQAFHAMKAGNNGITFSWKDGLIGYLNDTSFVYGAYGAIPGIWIKGADGKLAYGSVQPEIKQGLAKLRDWYSKGYIDTQSAMNNCWDQTAKEFVAEKSGVTSGPVWLYGQLKDSLFVNNKAAVVEACPIPAGPNGKAMVLGYNKLGNAFFFSKDFKNIEAFFDYYNTLYEKENPANEKLQYGFVKGMDYELDADGNALYEADMTKVNPLGKYEGWDQFLIGFNATHSVPYKDYEIYTKLFNGQTPSTPAEKAKSSDPDLVKSAAAILYAQKSIDLADAYFGPAPTNVTVWDNLKKQELNTFIQIIYGQKPLDDFDAFVTEWKAQGGDDITKEINDWYAANVK